MKNYLSYAEADELCEGLILQYIGRNIPAPEFVDIDGFAQNYMKCPVRYESFAESDPDKIGFTGDGRTPLFIYQNKRPVSVVFPARTIVLERFLLQPKENGHRRFTLAHEVGHLLAAQIDPDQQAYFHQEYDGERVYTLDEMRERYSIGEWQANALSAALLMPRFMVLAALQKFNCGRRLPVYGENVFRPSEKVILQKMADSLQVSHTALVIRLRQMQLLERHDISEYIMKELRLGEQS